MWRTNLRIVAIALCVVGFYTAIAHAIPQLQSEVPETLALAGDASPEALVGAGEKLFNGAGGCAKCHSVKGDLAGIGNKYDPPTLQQKFLFPRTFAVGAHFGVVLVVGP